MKQIDERLGNACSRILSMVERPGRRSNRLQLDSVNARFGRTLPEWYLDMMSAFPLAGLSLGWRDPSLEGETSWIRLGDERWFAECFDSYPSMYVRNRGYFPIGWGDLNAGNVFLLQSNSDPSGPLFELWHDVSHDPDVLSRALETGAPGATTVDPSFVHFLEICDLESIDAVDGEES